MFVLLDVYYSSMKIQFSQEVHIYISDPTYLSGVSSAASRQPGVIFVLKEALTLILPFSFYFLILKVISFYLKLASINKDKYNFFLPCRFPLQTRLFFFCAFMFAFFSILFWV